MGEKLGGFKNWWPILLFPEHVGSFRLERWDMEMGDGRLCFRCFVKRIEGEI